MKNKDPSLFTKIFIAMFTPWTSQRLWLAIICIFTLISFFWTGTYYLYSIPATHVATYDSMFQTVAWGVVTVVIGYILDMPTLLNGFKRTTVATTSNVVQNILSKEEVKIDQNITITEKVDERIVQKYANKFATDESYRPIATVSDLETEAFR